MYILTDLDVCFTKCALGVCVLFVWMYICIGVGFNTRFHFLPSVRQHTRWSNGWTYWLCMCMCIPLKNRGLCTAAKAYLHTHTGYVFGTWSPIVEANDTASASETSSSVPGDRTTQRPIRLANRRCRLVRHRPWINSIYFFPLRDPSPLARGVWANNWHILETTFVQFTGQNADPLDVRERILFFKRSLLLELLLQSTAKL